MNINARPGFLKLNLSFFLAFFFSVFFTENFYEVSSFTCDAFLSCPEQLSFDCLTSQLPSGITSWSECQCIDGILKIDSGATSVSCLTGLTHIKGNLEAIGVSSLTGLHISSLQEIGGDLILRSSNTLTSSGLSNLRIVNGSMEVSSIADSALHGISKVELIGGSVYISGSSITNPSISRNLINIPGDLTVSNTQVSSLSFLENVETIGGTMTIRLNSKLLIFEMKNLTSVGSIYIYYNSKLQFLTMEKLEEVNGDFRIETSHNVQNLYGLGALRNVNGFLKLNAASNFKSVSGLGNVNMKGLYLIATQIETLKTGNYGFNITNGDLHVKGGNLVTLEGLENTTGLNLLFLSSLNKLETLKGLENVEFIKEGCEITNSGALKNLSGLNNVVSIGKSLTLRILSSLSNLNDLEKLQTVGENIIFNGLAINESTALHIKSVQSIYVYTCTNYKSLQGFYEVTKLDYLWLENSYLENLDELINVKEINYIWLNGNSRLKNVDGLNYVDTVNNAIIVDNNNALESFKMCSLKRLTNQMKFKTSQPCLNCASLNLTYARFLSIDKLMVETGGCSNDPQAVWFECGDYLAPDVINFFLAPQQSSLTNQMRIEVIVQFDEVVGLSTPLNIVLNQTVSPDSYSTDLLVETDPNYMSSNWPNDTFTIILTGNYWINGQLELYFPKGAATDTGGNMISNIRSSSNTLVIEFDKDPPAVSIEEEKKYTATAKTSVTFFITLSEPCANTNLDPAVFLFDNTTVGGIAIENVIQNSNMKFTLQLTNTSEWVDGEIIQFALAANACTDAAGNGNVETLSPTLIYDISPPTVVMSAGPSQLLVTNTYPVYFYVNFSEPVYGMYDDDLYCMSLSTVTGYSLNVTLYPNGQYSDNFIASVSPLNNDVWHSGVVKCNVTKNAAWDEALNRNLEASDPFTISYDISPPIVLDVSLDSPNPTNDMNVTFIVRFNEPLLGGVDGFKVLDINVSQSTVGTVGGYVSSFDEGDGDMNMSFLVFLSNGADPWLAKGDVIAY